MPVKPRSLAALAAAVLWGAAAGGAAAAPGWLAPDTLTPAGSGIAPEVALAADGGGVAVWQERTAIGTGQPCSLVCTGGTSWRVRAAVRAANGSWSAPEALAEGTVADPATPADAPLGPQVAVDPSGAAVAVWRDSSGVGNVMAAVRPAGGPWGQAENVSGLGLFREAPSVVVDGSGNALAVWVEEEGGDDLVHAALRPSGEAWGLPEPLSAPGADVGGALAAFDGAGNAIVLWDRSDGVNQRAQAVIRPAGGAWGLPETISPAGRSISGGLDIDLRSDGAAVAAWAAPERSRP